MVRASGLSIKALRLYDANGLLVPARVDPRTGYRAYAPEQVERGRAIALLRRLDVPLARVPEVLDADPHDVRDVLLGWWDERQRTLAAQRAAAEGLARTLGGPPGRGPDRGTAPPGELDVRRRDVDPRTVATITSRTVQADLVPTFTADLLAIRAHLAAAGADTRPEHSVVFHELPGRDVPGLVETQVPFRGLVAPSGPVVLREDPARAEAYVEVPARDCRYPQIVAYHDALRDVAAQHHAWQDPAPTREVYAVPWSDEPEAIVAEVAVTLSPVSSPRRPVAL